ncbi:centriolin, partial [Aplysia californica]|uniref:Centriolin n=1 Tax=Aplysia californica TaxID=6500 RepID=A0ABM1A517_APLCA
MNRRGGAKGGPSNLPVPTISRASPANSITSSQGGRGRGNLTHSAEDIPRQYGVSQSPSSTGRRAVSPAVRRAHSPGDSRRTSFLSPARTSTQNMASQPGVRYITEDLIRKVAKEDNLDMITSLNLTLSKEGGKKIKYIENLDKLRKLQTLVLSQNLIEKMERMDKLLRLRELNMAGNMLTRIEGLENLTALQSLNVS